MEYLKNIIVAVFEQYLIGVAEIRKIFAQRRERKNDIAHLPTKFIQALDGEKDGQYQTAMYFGPEAIGKKRYWLEKAAKQGHLEAIRELQSI